MHRWAALYNDLCLKNNIRWKELYRQRLLAIKLVPNALRNIAETYHHLETLPDDAAQPLLLLHTENGISHELILHELHAILDMADRLTRLTEKYYASRVLRLLQKAQLTQLLREWLQLPETEQLLEDGAILVAKWFYDGQMQEANVKKQLDELANEVLISLQQSHANHPVCSRTDLSWKDITESRWEPLQCRQVILAINYTLKQLGFHGNTDDYYNAANSYINKVLELKQGIPITLSVVYQAVARRLGVVCDPVGFPSHFLLRFLEHPDLPGSQRYTYIDAFHCGRLLSAHECRTCLRGVSAATITEQNYQPVPFTEVLGRMTRNLYIVAHQQQSIDFLFDVLELCHVVEASDVITLNLARIYLNRNINLEKVPDLLSPLLASDHVLNQNMARFLITSASAQQRDNSAKKEVEAKKRSEEPGVTFSVGKIMKHKRYNYLCVIHSWDRECRASREWIHQMGVDMLARGQRQPFYGVLVEDGSNRYAAQENLEMAPEPRFIDHEDVGKYFDEYRDTYFVLNSTARKHYPEDMEYTIEEARTKYNS